MKIGIVTITDGQNYGNRLQNYAMQTMLENLGASVETIRRYTSHDLYGINKIKSVVKSIIKWVIRYPSRNHYQMIRKRKFDVFNDRYVKFSKYKLENNISPVDLAEQYDFFIVGSDQVWNARFQIVREDIENYVALFAKPEQKIAYAASFGTDDVVPEYWAFFSKALSTFKAIGVRENSGVDIVRSVAKRYDAQVVLDPTMMLNVKQWRKIEKKPRYIKNEKYIVTYFLGGRNAKIQEYIKNLSEQYQARVVNLEIEFLMDASIEDKNVFVTSPDEFVWLIDHSECVLTDSFHASVFSILFHKPFTTFERVVAEKENDMGSRIQTLLGMFDLLEFYGDVNNPKVVPKRYDTEKIETILEQQRRMSFHFLKKALED